MFTAEKPQIETKTGWKFPLTKWAVGLFLSVAVVVYIACKILKKQPPHALGIGGTFLVLMGVIYSGLAIAISYQKDKLDIGTLEDIKAKLRDEHGSVDVLHNKLDVLMDVLISNAKDRKAAGINQVVVFCLSFFTAAVGTGFLVFDFLYA